ncbi:MAG: hypothetical protein M9894_36275 [Planctomycetes bacterium]|nr:hypothetical protein [Planctomycetota bacterium]
MLRRADEAQAAARRLLELAPGCAAARLEAARVLALGVEEAALFLDLARHAGAPAPERERALADRLDEVARAHRRARATGATDPDTDDAARLGAARALVEAAWRRTVDDEDDERHEAALAALARALDDELRPLVARVDVTDVARARAALAAAAASAEPGALEGAVLEAERGLAAAAWGEPPRPLDLAALEALLLRAAAPGGDDHAAAYLALAGDLPARALLWARRAAATGADPAGGERWLSHAVTLHPELPAVVLQRELAPGREVTAAGLLRLARAVAGAPERARAALDGLVALPPADEATTLARLAAADAPAAERHLAAALLLRGTRVFPPGADDPAHARVVAERAAWHDRASRQAYVATTRALRGAPAGAAARVVRALATSSLARGAGLGAPCDPRVLPDALFDARLARGAAPWAAAPLLVELDLGPPGVSGAAADELVLHGFAGSVVARLQRVHPGRALPAGLQRLAGVLPALATAGPEQLLELAGRLDAQGAPRAALAARLQRVVARPDLRDDGGEERFERLLAAATRGRPDLAAAAAATSWAARARHDEEDERARRRAVEEAARAAHLTRVGGVGTALHPRQVLASGARPAGDVGRDALPGSPGLGDLWTGLARPERALVVLARAAHRPETAAVVVEDEDAPGERTTVEVELVEAPLEGLLHPWGRSRAHLLDLQAPWQGWAVDRWTDGGEPGDAQLALDRALAFGRASTAEGAYWTIFWQLRWHAVGADNDVEVRRAHAALARSAALRLGDLTGSPALRGLAADALLDLAALDAAEGGELDPGRVRRALDEAEAVAPEQVEARLESAATAWWRLARARALAGDREGALAALARVRALAEDGDAWGLTDVVTAEDPALPWLRRLPEVAAFVDRWTDGR